MLKFAANLTWLFNDLPLLERFGAAAAAGFNGVECLFPYEAPLAQLVDARRNSRVEMVLINAPAGDWARGDRGLASLPGRQDEFRASLRQAREYALALGCGQVHIMAGNRDESISAERQYAQWVSAIRTAADYFSADGIRVLIEPLNNEDMPNYFVSSFSLVEKLIHDCHKETVFLQLDIYHCQKIQGNLLGALQRYWPLISHMQIASVPYRQEPAAGEINYPWMFKQLERLHYQGWIGCEYRPEIDTLNGLRWLRDYKVLSAD